MKARGAAIQGGLAAVGLVAVYATWQREPERGPGEAVVIDVAKSDVKKVRLDDGAGKWVELERKDGAVWLKVSANAERKSPERKLRGSESAEKLFEKFGPLKATRALGVLAADKVKELGLEGAKKKLTVEARGQTTTFLVGTSPYGVSDPYVKDERDGRVYVLGGSVLTDLDAAAVRLVDRALHGFQPGEFGNLVVTAGGKKRAFVQSGGQAGVAAKLAPAKAPDKADDLAKNWHEKVWRLVPVEIMGQHELPTGGAPQVALRLDYATAGGKDKGWLELGRVPQQGTPAPGTMPGPEIYGRTEHTAGWVKFAQSADELIKEGEKVAATE